MGPKPFEQILAAVDADGLASNALVRALKLATAFDARVGIVHAVEIPPPMGFGVAQQELAALRTTALAHERDRVLKVVDLARREAGFRRAAAEELLRVESGHPAHVILEAAEEMDADLIVLGPHAHRSIFDFGSTARAVLSRSPAPVWTQVERVEDVESILVPVDLSDHSRRAVEWAKLLSARFGASLRLLHAYQPPAFAFAGATADAIPGPTYVVDHERKAAREELLRWAEQVGGEAVFVERPATEAVLEHADDADLVVIGTHGRTGLSRFLLGSVAYAVLKQCAKPVLAVPEPHRHWMLGKSEVKSSKESTHSKP